MNEATPRPPEGDPLFRREAVEEYLRGRDHGHLLNVSPLLSVWSFGLLLAVFAGAVTFAAITRVGTDVRGRAVVRSVPGDATRFEAVCVLPATADVAAHANGPVVVDFGGAPPRRLTLTLHSPARRTSVTLARAELGDAAATVTSDDPVLLLRAPLPAPAAGAEAWRPGASGTVWVRTGEQSLWSALLFQKVTP